jgi:hypothetical protein
MSIKAQFRKSLEEGYKKYLSVHPRSSEKIIPMHKCLSEIILSKLGGKNAGFSVKSMGIDDNKEYNFKGKYYSKDLDITILYKNKPISGLGFKFITSNYKQNSNNYFENMLGETANLKRTDFLYGQVLVFKHKMPYYSSDKKTFTKIEHINEKNIAKYVKLHNDNVPLLYHKPDIVFLSFVETGDEAEFEKIVKLYEQGTPKKINKSDFHKEQLKRVKIKFIGTDELSKNEFSEKTLQFLEKVSNFENFVNAFVNLTKGKIYGK